jgi:CheY-like chemotaxis protein
VGPVEPEARSIVTEPTLDPRVRSLLEDQLEERDLEMDVVESMLQAAQRVEGEELEDTVREILQEEA